MNKKHGLGKGLNALIPEDISKELLEENKEVKKISINLIKANKHQPRKNFNQEKIEELSRSIKEHGIIQPLIVKKNGSIYDIIAGERRWRAAKIVGVKEVPVIIKNLTEKEILEISLIENIQREDLNPIEEANAFKRLIEDFNLTQQELAKRLSKSRSSITNCLRLLKLDNRVQEYLVNEVITEGHARTLLSIEDQEIQYKVANLIIKKSFSVRQTETFIKNLSKSKNKKNSIKKENPYCLDIQYRLENLFQTKVFLKDKKNKGKIEIEYYSNEDLQRILDILEV